MFKFKNKPIGLGVRRHDGTNAGNNIDLENEHKKEGSTACLGPQGKFASNDVIIIMALAGAHRADKADRVMKGTALLQPFRRIGDAGA